jgi:hypothetical protein
MLEWSWTGMVDFKGRKNSSIYKIEVGEQKENMSMMK